MQELLSLRQQVEARYTAESYARKQLDNVLRSQSQCATAGLDAAIKAAMRDLLNYVCTRRPK